MSGTDAGQRKVWLVVKVGVYDHGCQYVAESREDAERFCAENEPDEDGYHEWRIDEMPLGTPPASSPMGQHP